MLGVGVWASVTDPDIITRLSQSGTQYLLRGGRFLRECFHFCYREQGLLERNCERQMIGLRASLMRVSEESEKTGLKLNSQKIKIMTSNPIISWQIDGENVEIVADFIFLGSKITLDGDCSHEIKRLLLLGGR